MCSAVARKHLRLPDAVLHPGFAVRSIVQKKRLYLVQHIGELRLHRLHRLKLIPQTAIFHALARTSAQPGKTQTINFYNINDAMYLVDLPGYGYAKASEEVKAKWGKMIENYLHTSKRLKAVFLLIDIRHDPSANDRMMYEWMVYQGFAPIIIATKLDKIKRSQIQKNVKAIREGLGVQPGTMIIPFSAETKQGREEIWELIDSLVLPQDE